MRILLVGGGGREHALADGLRRSPRCSALHVAPGNPGIAALAHAIHAVKADDVDGQVALARRVEADLVVVGPEAPLAAGLADRCRAVGVACFGPGAAAARLESSKAFAKDLMRRLGIPTARYEVFDDPARARATVAARAMPIVIKADGLCAGKGVVVCGTAAEAMTAIDEMLAHGRFGEAGRRIVVEEFLAGVEVSVQAVTDGETLCLLPPARDHKRVGEGDTGPNTGGMGAYSPVPDLDEGQLAHITRDVFVPMLHGLAREGLEFRGLLYAGLMLTRSGPKVLEWNVRFGDPEAQVVVPRLEGDLAVLLHAAATGTLGRVAQRPFGPPAVCVVAAAPGYPGTPRTGDVIEGIAGADALPDTRVFQAGTASRDGACVTAGGRVLSVCGRGPTLAAARARAYEGLTRIKFPGMVVRRDIAARV